MCYTGICKYEEIDGECTFHIKDIILDDAFCIKQDKQIDEINMKNEKSQGENYDI